jgi:glycosyltransferase involved in cell wall biosynthesis
MLEAWAHGLPTISSVNPDDLVTREGLGAVAVEFPELVSETGRLLGDPEARREVGRRARAYVERHHAPDVVYDRLAGVLDRVVAATRERRAARR